MLAYLVSVILSNTVYHLLTTIRSSDTAEMERLGKSKMLTVSLTLSRFSTKKSRFRISPAIVWNIWRALYLSLNYLCRPEISTSSRSLYLGSVAIFRPILGRSSNWMILISQHRDSYWICHILYVMTSLFGVASAGTAIGTSYMMYFSACGCADWSPGNIYLHSHHTTPLIWSSI